MTTDDLDATRGEDREAVGAAACKCGHSFAQHTGHTTFAGQKPSFHCSQGCGCTQFLSDWNATHPTPPPGEVERIRSDPVIANLRAMLDMVPRKPTWGEIRYLIAAIDALLAAESAAKEGGAK